MEYNLTIETIKDFNNNLDIIRVIYNSQKDKNFKSYIDCLIFNFFSENLESIFKDIKFSNLTRIYNKINNNNQNYSFYNVFNIILDFIYEQYLDLVIDREENVKLSKIYIYRELLNIIHNY